MTAAKKRRSIYSRADITFTIALLVLSLSAVSACAGREVGRQRMEGVEGRLSRLEGEGVLPLGSGFPRPPGQVFLCDYELPLWNQDVRERFEREFYLMVSDVATTTMWLKRSAQYFPMFEPVLAEAGVCDDAKYLSVIESGLHPTIRSSAGAIGIWQFMPATGREWNLHTGESFDYRRNPALATVAAAGFLRQIYNRFDDWPLAFAAYNLGPNGLARRMREQGARDFFDLYLPNETSRYVLRIAAAKVVMENAAHYGYVLAPKDKYQLPVTTTTNLEVPAEGLSLMDLASRLDNITYRELRLLNPHLLRNNLAPGSYTLHLPADRWAGADPAGGDDPIAAFLVERRKGSDNQEQAVRVHVVKEGETLLDIARQHNTGVQDIIHRNNLRKPDRIFPGQELRI